MITPHSHKIPIALIGTTTLLPLLGVGVATASILPGGIGDQWQDWVLENWNPLEQVMGELEQATPVLETVMQDSLGEVWQDLQTYTDSTLPNSYEIRNASDPLGAGVLTASPIVRQRDLANLYDQETARALAAPMLGEDGEQWLIENAEQATALVESSQQGMGQVQQLAEQAQGLGVTQDVMKTQAEIDSAIAALLTQQTQLDAQNHTTLLELQRLDGIMAQLAANTSEGVDENNRRDRLERQVQISGSTQAPVYIPGLLGTGEPGEATSGRE
ncbi:MAG: hypothetical protein AAFY67_18430 [Cyanobacteria bacterium J06642_9]